MIQPPEQKHYFARFCAKVSGVRDEIIVSVEADGSPRLVPGNLFQCYTCDRTPFVMSRTRFWACYRKKEKCDEPGDDGGGGS